jgi:hypothetical protein
MARKQVESTEQKVLKLTEWLSSEQTWNWAVMHSDRDSAYAVLKKMAELGLIQHERHKFGGDIWTAEGKKFGRVDY